MLQACYLSKIEATNHEVPSENFIAKRLEKLTENQDVSPRQHLDLTHLLQSKDYKFQENSADKIFLAFTHGNFKDDSYLYYDYTYLNTVILLEPAIENLNFSIVSDLKNNFHIRNVHYLINDWDHVDRFKLFNSTYRLEKITFWTQFIRDKNFTGINLDFELPLYSNSLRSNMMAFVEEFTVAMKKLLPTSIVSFDVPYQPHPNFCLSGRCIDYSEIASVVDYLIIMGYDTQQSPIVSQPTAMDNILNYGVKQFIKNGVNANRLVIALPWYFPIYKCQARLYGACFEWVLRDKKQYCYRSLYDGSISYQLTSNKLVFGSYQAQVTSKNPNIYDSFLQASNDLEMFYDNGTTLFKKMIEIEQVGRSEMKHLNSIKGFGIFRANCLDNSIEYQEENDKLWYFMNLGMENLVLEDLRLKEKILEESAENLDLDGNLKNPVDAIENTSLDQTHQKIQKIIDQLLNSKLHDQVEYNLFKKHPMIKNSVELAKVLDDSTSEKLESMNQATIKSGCQFFCSVEDYELFFILMGVVGVVLLVVLIYYCCCMNCCRRKAYDADFLL